MEHRALAQLLTKTSSATLSDRRAKMMYHVTMDQNNQESRLKYWATRSSIHSFTYTSHSFACYTLLVSLARSAALIRLLIPKLMGM